MMETLIEAITENWIVWFVTIVLVVAAVIDGKLLKVPNWLTFPPPTETPVAMLLLIWGFAKTRGGT